MESRPLAPKKDDEMHRSRLAARAARLNTAVHVAPKKNQILLGGGYAFPEMLPDVSVVAAEVAREFRTSILQYGPLMGLSELRDAIVAFIASDGINVTTDNILITNGAKSAMELALKVFIEKGDTIVVSRPNYATALHLFRTHEASLLEVDMDEDGLRTDLLEERLVGFRQEGRQIPKLVYVVPDSHNPTGITLSLDRRRRLVELAEEFDFYILEDDPYRRIHFEGDLLPPLQALDRNARVIGAGTVSKVFAPGIRIGWANAAPDIIARMAALKSDGGCSPFTQKIVASMMKSGELTRHSQEVSAELCMHRDVMIRALRSHWPEVRFSTPKGGYYLWVELPPGLDCDLLTSEAEASGVTIFSGRPYFADAQPSNFIRLCYATSGPEDIERGIEVLGGVAKRLHNLAGAGLASAPAIGHFD
jgi:2-aminoadipate transaminase